MNQQNTSKGYLEFTVNIGDTLAPIDGATVEIFSKNGTKIETLSTDMNGKTETISLPAPKKELASDPNATVRPYALYDAIITKPGYMPQKVEVQILGDSKAVPETGLKENSHRFNQGMEVVRVGDHALFSGQNTSNNTENPYNIAAPLDIRSFYKPLADQSPYFLTTIQGIVIPEFVRVNMVTGPEDTVGTSIDVRFPEYIKTVLAGEIYGNWEPEAIKANVVAAVSYTLNRIYTKWYLLEGQGDFDVYNNTKDHCYKCKTGVTLQESINNIVDEFFTEYIGYPQDQFRYMPFLSQYCSGRETRCAASNKMEQWGSQELALSGMKYTDILKKYYGSNTEVQNASFFTVDDRMHFSDRELRPGESSQKIKTIKHQLNIIRTKYPGIPQLEETEIFDDNLLNAVHIFQREVEHIPVTDVIDKKTLYRITRKFISISKLVYTDRNNAYKSNKYYKVILYNGTSFCMSNIAYNPNVSISGFTYPNNIFVNILVCNIYSIVQI
ncbi:SpoIID/LytB domain-containing protein [Pseudobacteroides cellulosolvens]|uniref:Stage II sporulation protein D n=1 Tax=Pseudobacteroides cellulosolvens ATCC 35603 = DSM 2933 TaxID=398512 RepID=A0A0L6JIT2_9FIRM|nr:SpoIID/LytB domain-containing protein [Pseudobacteroides cellulosolvens]KNY25654.1 Stage II sporulation protein D [Pseudobacteroides cellulosolvens ATCC 35603 = DSM 2933]